MNCARKKGGSYEEVRNYILDRIRIRDCPEDPFIRINSEEIASKIGISSSAVRIHLRKLIDNKVIFRKYGSLYALHPQARLSASVGEAPAPGPECASRSLEKIKCSEPPVTRISPEASDHRNASGHVSESVPRPSNNLPADSIKILDRRSASGHVSESVPRPSNNLPADSIKILDCRSASDHVSESVPRPPTNLSPGSFEILVYWGTCDDVSENVPRPSSNLPLNSAEIERIPNYVSESVLRPPNNLPHDSKKELQERKEKKEKEKIVDLLGDWVDSTSPEYIKIHRQATTLFNKYSAGVRRGTSPALINRFVAGCMLEIPLVNFEELEDQLRQAEKEFLLYESFRGTGKRLGIRRPFVRIASYLKKCFEADGWLWSKLTSPFEHRLKRAHRAKQATPVFPQMEDDSKLQPNSKTSTTFSDSRPPSAPPAPPQKKPAQREAGKQNPLRIGDIIKNSGIGKIPPQVVTPQK